MDKQSESGCGRATPISVWWDGAEGRLGEVAPDEPSNNKTSALFDTTVAGQATLECFFC